MKLGIGADHGGYELKGVIASFLKDLGHDLIDYGAFELDSKDDYPDFIIPLAKAVAEKKIERGIAICGSGVGAAIAANKVKGVRAALIHDHFSAHQGVEDDDMNVICLGGRVTGFMAAEELIAAFLDAKFTGAERHKRRLQKVELMTQSLPGLH
ncbi:MAG: RpiB/LacA/LacB family sugar-phosphate isomerase [Ginsengibacter sp.]